MIENIRNDLYIASCVLVCRFLNSSASTIMFKIKIPKNKIGVKLIIAFFFINAKTDLRKQKCLTANVEPLKYIKT